MRGHLWMHAGLLAVILAIFGLSALGVAIPTGVVYLVVLACPLMMIFMMFGMNHDKGADHGAPVEREDQVQPPAGTSR